MIDEIIARECSRYIKKETIYHGENVQAIYDTHSMGYLNNPIKVAPIGDKHIDSELIRMNAEYENQLRTHFKEVMQ